MREEVVSYFRHVEGVSIRKDCKEKAAYEPAAFYDASIATSMYVWMKDPTTIIIILIIILISSSSSTMDYFRAQLCQVEAILRRHAEIVTSYYVEYLVEVDLPMVSRLVSECCERKDFTTCVPYLDAIIRLGLGKVSAREGNRGATPFVEVHPISLHSIAFIQVHSLRFERFGGDLHSPQLASHRIDNLATVQSRAFLTHTSKTENGILTENIKRLFSSLLLSLLSFHSFRY